MSGVGSGRDIGSLGEVTARYGLSQEELAKSRGVRVQGDRVIFNPQPSSPDPTWMLIAARMEQQRGTGFQNKDRCDESPGRPRKLWLPLDTPLHLRLACESGLMVEHDVALHMYAGNPFHELVVLFFEKTLQLEQDERTDDWVPLSTAFVQDIRSTISQAVTLLDQAMRDAEQWDFAREGLRDLPCDNLSDAWEFIEWLANNEHPRCEFVELNYRHIRDLGNLLYTVRELYELGARPTLEDHAARSVRPAVWPRMPGRTLPATTKPLDIQIALASKLTMPLDLVDEEYAGNPYYELARFLEEQSRQSSAPYAPALPSSAFFCRHERLFRDAYRLATVAAAEYRAPSVRDVVKNYRLCFKNVRDVLRQWQPGDKAFAPDRKAYTDLRMIVLCARALHQVGVRLPGQAR